MEKTLQYKYFRFITDATESQSWILCGEIFSYDVFFCRQGPAGPAGPKGARGGAGPPVSISSTCEIYNNSCDYIGSNHGWAF